MTAVLSSVRDQIATDWEAATPPDRTGVAYKNTEGRGKRTGTSGDRTFWFRPESRTLVGQKSTIREIEYTMVGCVRFSSHGRKVDEFFDAVIEEAELLSSKIDNRASWPAGTIGVTADSVVYDFGEDEFVSDTVIEILIAVRVEESIS